MFVAGAANAARFRFAIPNNPVLVDLRFYQQALVPDPVGNAAGAVMSDAAAAIIGR